MIALKIKKITNHKSKLIYTQNYTYENKRKREHGILWSWMLCISCVACLIFEFQRPFQANHFEYDLSLSLYVKYFIMLHVQSMSTFSLKMYFIHLYAPYNQQIQLQLTETQIQMQSGHTTIIVVSCKMSSVFVIIVLFI